MKYCAHCGAEVFDEAVLCVKCGCSLETEKTTAAVPAQKDDTMQIVVKVLMILSCVSVAWFIIPLAWCIPMTVSVFKSFREGRTISTGMKVCTLIFVNLAAGVCLLCMNDNA